jgi:hypothetical protein
MARREQEPVITVAIVEDRGRIRDTIVDIMRSTLMQRDLRAERTSIVCAPVGLRKQEDCS